VSDEVEPGDHYATLEDWELRNLLYDRDESMAAYEAMARELDARVMDARAELDATRVELRALVEAASLTGEEQDMALDGDAGRLLESISLRLGAGIERASLFLKGGAGG
jgi:hypothetical protein